VRPVARRKGEIVNVKKADADLGVGTSSVLRILDSLPSSLDWVVVFELAALDRVMSNATVRAVFALPASLDLDRVSYIVLTSEGPLLAETRGLLMNPSGGSLGAPSGIGDSLSDRFRDELSLLDVPGPSCLGLGQRPPFPPVLMWVVMEDFEGQAAAVLWSEPSGSNFDLLQAVGVSFLGTERIGERFLARFHLNLMTHIEAGRPGEFAHAGNCTRFFLRQGEVDDPIRSGLLDVANERLDRERRRIRRSVFLLADQAVTNHLGMTCKPPPPQEAFSYGDVVPLAFLLKAMEVDPPDSENGAELRVWSRVRESLLSKRKGLLWSYHTGGLVTCTDSALVLQAFQNPDGVEALEAFGDGDGAYWPQRCTQDVEPGSMRLVSGNRHWCQPDYPTTCLVHALRDRTNLPARARAFLADRFATRSGLFFANPYMVDWALALALQRHPSLSGFAQRLRSEILASQNPDYSFGVYDVALSTSFAILGLAALGSDGSVIRAAQLRLSEFRDETGIFPPSTPFYSTKWVEDGDMRDPGVTSVHDSHGQRGAINGIKFALTLYQDTHGLVSTGAALLALSSPVPTDGEISEAPAQQPNRRYTLRDHCEYIWDQAMPPYVLRFASNVEH